MDSLRKDFEKNIVIYYNCKLHSPCLPATGQEMWYSESDITVLNKRIKVLLFVGCIPPGSSFPKRNLVSIQIVTHDGCIEFPLCGVNFDLDDDLKNIIKAEPCGFDTQKEIFDELINIFKTWGSSMDEFIERLKLLNISLI